MAMSLTLQCSNVATLYQEGRCLQDRGLFGQMMELYPHWVANQSWLLFGFPVAIGHINR
jgi:hypothetical protein